MPQICLTVLLTWLMLLTPARNSALLGKEFLDCLVSDPVFGSYGCIPAPLLDRDDVPDLEECCGSLNGLRLRFYSGIRESIEDASSTWHLPDYVQVYPLVRQWYQQLSHSDAEYLLSSSMCLPPQCVQDRNSATEAAWHYMLHRGAITFPDAIRQLPVPDTALAKDSLIATNACETLRLSNLIGFGYAPLHGQETWSRKCSKQAFWAYGYLHQHSFIDRVCGIIIEVAYAAAVRDVKELGALLTKHDLDTLQGIQVFLGVAIHHGWKRSALALLDNVASVLSDTRGGLRWNAANDGVGMVPWSHLQTLWHWLIQLDDDVNLAAIINEFLSNPEQSALYDPARPRVSHQLCRHAKGDTAQTVLHVVAGYIRQGPSVRHLDELVLLLYDEYKDMEPYLDQLDRERSAGTKHSRHWVAPTSDNSSKLEVRIFLGGVSYRPFTVMHSDVGVHVHCLIPRSLGLAHTFRELAAALHWETYSQSGTIPLHLCRVSFWGPPVTMCLKPVWAPGTWEVYPDLVLHWVLHHKRIGIDRFQLYDLDGALHSQVDRLQGMGLSVRYFERFGQQFATLERLRLEHGLTYLIEELSWEHCRMSNIGISDWVQFVHGLDSFLFSSKDLLVPEILEFVTKGPHKNICGVAVQTAVFGGQRTIVEGVAGGQSPIPYEFLWREPNLTEAWHVSEIAVRPAAALTASNHRLVCELRSETFVVPPDMLRSNHYFDVMQTRCSTCDVRDTALRDALSKLPPLEVP